MIQRLPSTTDSRHAAQPHVLLVLDQFPKNPGGGERVVLRLAELLPRYGFRASVLTFSIHPESTLLSQTLPFPVYHLPLTRTWNLEAIRAALALRRLIREESVRIVQTFFESSDLWAGLVVKTLSGARLVWNRRDMGILRSSKHRIAYRLMAALPDKVFAVSEEVRRHCIETDHVISTRVQTIYNGINLSAWKVIERPAPGLEGPMITTVGNIRRVKGHDVLIHAAAAVLKQYPNSRFSIAGEVLEPSYYAELESLTRKLGIANQFKFLGGLVDPRKHLAAADLFVLPSRSEGFSNAILEAMASSLPVIATRVGGNAEAIQNGVNGLLVPAEDVDALARAMMCLLGDPERSKRMGIEGRRLVEDKFSIDAMMTRIATVFGGLLQS